MLLWINSIETAIRDFFEGCSDLALVNDLMLHDRQQENVEIVISIEAFIYNFFKEVYEDLTSINNTLLNSTLQQEYITIIISIVIALIICIVLGLVAYLLSIGRIQDNEKLSEYECGFEPFDNATRLPFDVHFYIVGILFLIFDVEIALLFP